MAMAQKQTAYKTQRSLSTDARPEIYKREQAIQRENERRTALIEEQNTQQLVDNLVYETGRLLRNGAFPGSQTFDPNGPTYVPPSRTSSYVGHMPHSLSSGSLNPMKPQHSAVQSHFQQMNQQMRPCENGPVNSEQQYLRRSTSTPSTVDGDMGTPSVQIQLRTEYGTQAVDVPVSLAEELKQLPANERVHRLHKYFKQTQEQTCQKRVSGPYNPANVEIPPQLWEKIKDLPEDVQEKSIHYYCDELNRQTNSGDLPMINNSSRRQKTCLYSLVYETRSGILVMAVIGIAMLGMHMAMYPHVSSNTSLRNPYEEQNAQGGVPYLSIFDEDGLPCGRSFIPTEVRSISGERSSIMNQEGHSISDRSCVGTEELSMGEPTSMKKTAMTIQSEKKIIEPAANVVHYTINVYGPTNLQVGDQNVMETTSSKSDVEDDDDDDDDANEGGTSVKVSSGRSKKRPSQDSALGEEQQLKPCKDSEYNDEEATSSKLGYRDEADTLHSTERPVSGEARPSQGPPSAAGASCNVDAAPSAQYTPPMKMVAKAVANHLPEVVAEEGSDAQREELSTSQKSKQIKQGSIEQVKTSKTSEGSFLEESVNMKSPQSWFTKSSEGQKNIVSVPPVVKPNWVQEPNTSDKHGTLEKQMADVRTQAVVKPKAVVKPIRLSRELDNDNEDQTYPKSLARSENTSATAVNNSGVSMEISQSTVVNQVATASPPPMAFSVNQSQNSQQQNTSQVTLHGSREKTNATVATMHDSHEQTHAKVAQFGFTNYSKQHQFCMKLSLPKERVKGNMDSIDDSEVEVVKEASLTNQETHGHTSVFNASEVTESASTAASLPSLRFLAQSLLNLFNNQNNISTSSSESSSISLSSPEQLSATFSSSGSSNGRKRTWRDAKKKMYDAKKNCYNKIGRLADIVSHKLEHQ